MIKTIWETIVYEPLYNALVFILQYTPGHYAWIGIIGLTFFMRLVLFPFYQNMIRTQKVLREIQPELKAIQEKYKNNRAELGLKVMEVYKTHKVNPFSMIGFLIFIQIPVFLGLYFVFSKGLINHEGALYSFVQFPEAVNTLFLGMNLLDAKIIPIALLAGVAQYIHSRQTVAKQPPAKERVKGEMPSFGDELQRSLQFQTLYFIPVLITVTAYFFPAAIGLYWIVNSVISIGQEKLIATHSQ
jgi:YidC/Oxa1 family membrane protein insertase